MARERRWQLRSIEALTRIGFTNPAPQQRAVTGNVCTDLYRTIRRHLRTILNIIRNERPVTAEYVMSLAFGTAHEVSSISENPFGLPTSGASLNERM